MHVSFGTWKKSGCELKHIRPVWLISVSGSFDLSFRRKSCYVPLHKKCFKLFSCNGCKFWKSQTSAFSLQVITVLHKPQNSLKQRLFEKKLALNFINPLAIRRFSDTILPPAVRSAIHHGRGTGNQISGACSGSSSSHLTFLAPAPALSSERFLFWLQSHLAHWKLKINILFAQLACPTN